jgi:enoyl-CoA hydratase/carnithine racemase
VKEPASESAERMRRVSRKLYKDMLEVGQPIVCALNGPAIGAGCSLALLCDFVLASSAVTRSRANSRAGHRSSRDRDRVTGANRHRTFGKFII